MRIESITTNLDYADFRHYLNTSKTFSITEINKPYINVVDEKDGEFRFEIAPVYNQAFDDAIKIIMGEKLPPLPTTTEIEKATIESDDDYNNCIDYLESKSYTSIEVKPPFIHTNEMSIEVKPQFNEIFEQIATVFGIKAEVIEEWVGTPTKSITVSNIKFNIY